MNARRRAVIGAIIMSALRLSPAAGAASVIRSTDDIDQANASYLNRLAILLMIRATFDVVAYDDIPLLLRDAYRQMETAGPTGEDIRILNRDLAAEASYYLVSLKYVIAVGGAAWPTDIPASEYELRARARLNMLEDQLSDVLTGGADPQPIMSAAQEILAWTEGTETVPPDGDHFARRDAIVSTVVGIEHARMRHSWRSSSKFSGLR